MNRLIKFTVTLGGIGYLPASGTIASAIIVGIMALAPFTLIPVALGLLTALLGFLLAKKAVQIMKSNDPHPFVIDECCGMALSLVGLPLNAWNLIGGFFLFRLFDITKPLGIGRIDRWKHPSAIIWDDVLAAVYTNMVLRLLALFFAETSW